jgi:hypothetical protein
VSNYYVMEGSANGPVVLFYSLSGPARGDGWMLGRKFTGQIKEPLEVEALADFDAGIIMPFYPTPPIMRRDLYDAVRSAGVDNIDAWDAVLRKEDGTILSTDYKAVNILGAVSAANPEGTVFTPDVPSRLIDASIESLQIDDHRARGLLMFRLAEYMGAVVVHLTVKAAIQGKGITNVAFRDAPDFLS